jgi:hypothetical protein
VKQTRERHDLLVTVLCGLGGLAAARSLVSFNGKDPLLGALYLFLSIVLFALPSYVRRKRIRLRQ